MRVQAVLVQRIVDDAIGIIYISDRLKDTERERGKQRKQDGFMGAMDHD